MRAILVLFGFIFISASLYTTHSYANTSPDLGALYEDWKQEFLTADGAHGYLRVLQNKDRRTTVSEGQGYGMLLAAYHNDADTFDSLWKYTELYLNDRGVMHWQIDANGSVIGRNGATDGDEDIAFALLVAYRQWGSYEEEARAYIHAIFTHEVEKDTYVLKPGDVWGGSNITNPSYCAPAYYRSFADFTGESDWLHVLDRCYSVIEKARHTNTGLVPEWTTIDGGIAYDLTHNKNRDNFSYNAIRVPWRIAIDWAWNQDPRAYAITDRMTNFFDAQRKLYSGYTLSGKPTVSYFDATFAAGIAAGSIASNNNKFQEEILKRLIEMTSNSYYGATLRLLSLMLVLDEFSNRALLTIPETNSIEEIATTTPEIILPAGDSNEENEILPEKEPTEETNEFPPEESLPEENTSSDTPTIIQPEEESAPELEDEQILEPTTHSNYDILIESPEDGVALSGEKKIKAYIENLSLEEYTMTYSVEDITNGEMLDAAGTFKQAKIQFDQWTWNNNGPYIVTLTAYDMTGNMIGNKNLTLYVKQ